MRLSCGAPAARLPWGVCVACVWLCLCAVALAQNAPAKKSSSSDVLNAPPPAPELTEQDEQKPPDTGATKEKAQPQAAPKPAAPSPRKASAPKSESAPAAAAEPAAAPSPRKASVPKPASPPAAAEPAAVPSTHKTNNTQPQAADAPAATRKASPAKPASPPSPAAEPAAGGPPKASAPKPGSPPAAAEASAAEETPPDATPPPPSLDGDFAGPGAPAAAESPANAATQDDFAAEAQEYSKKKKREYSVRIDLLNWLLLGRLSIELEAGLWKFLSVQLTPVFVLAQSPIAINYAGLDDPLTQHSNGIGPLSGISLGIAAWLWGEPFKGYVLRLEITNYGYSYRTKDSAGQIDRVDFTERRAILFIGSHSRFGAFTFAGGFGLGYELNQQTRCGLSIDGDDVRSRENDCHGRQQIALDRGIEERADLNGPLHPVYFQARFSIGVVF